MTNDKTSQSPAVKHELFYGYIIVCMAFLVMAMQTGSRSAFGIFLKPMLTDLGISRGLTSGAFSLSLLVTGSLSIPVGKSLDKFGPRITITICGLFMGLGYLLMSQANSALHLYLFYGLLIGVGSTAYIPAISTVARWFKMRRNMMTSIVGAGGSIGTLAIPLLANWLISTYDWHLSFAILGTIILIGVVASAQFIKGSPTTTGQIAYGENAYNELKHQLKSKDISLQEAVFTMQFWLLTMVFFLNGFGSYAILVHIVPYATDQGISATNAASIVSLVGGTSIAGRLMMGSIGDRFGENRSILIGYILKAAAMIWLMSAKELWMLYPFAIVLGLSYGTGTVGSASIADNFGLSSHGAILGACQVGYAIGVAIGPLMAGYVFDLTNSYEIAFFVVTLIAIFGIVVTILLQLTQAKQARIAVK